MPTFKNILCPVDFSASSRHALAVATELAKTSDATLTIVHVWQPPLYGTVDAPVSGEIVQSIIDDAERALADWEASAKAGGVRVLGSKMLTGDPAKEIVISGTSSHADLIVMATHGRSGLKHVLLGSVAEKVVRHAACDVLVVRGDLPTYS
jgi:nucleotide-binding universal stress UspA family protein